MIAFEPAAIVEHAAALRAPAGETFAFHDPAALGTRLSLRIRAIGYPAAVMAARRVRAEIDRLNLILNWRDPASELSRLNGAELHFASPDLFAVISAAEHWRTISNGAFSGRLGRLGALWRASEAPPAVHAAAELARAAETAEVGLDPDRREIMRPHPVSFDLDALAKGYIVDRAVEASMASPGVTGVLLEIGGDVRAAGGADWLVGLPDPLAIHDNAALIGSIRCRDQAVATSGCGPRDRQMGAHRFSATLDPRTGQPVPQLKSVNAIAACAMEADALATAVLNLSPDDGARLVRTLPGAFARVTDPDGAHWAGAAAPQWVPIANKAAAQASRTAGKWPERWVAFVNFAAPPKEMQRDIARRSPYVAIWVSDTRNTLVKTLFLVGTVKEWQRENYMWWGLNGAKALDMVSVRSLSTRNTGEYKVLWDGTDESGKPVPAGRYVIHVETSRERGQHTHRSVEMDFSQPKPLSAELPMNPESGRLSVTFGRF